MARTNILVLTKTSSRRLQDFFRRRKAKANIFVLIKTSCEDEDKRRLQDVFIKKNVCWGGSVFDDVFFTYGEYGISFKESWSYSR